MRIIEVKFASKLSLLTAFILFVIVIATPAICYRVKYIHGDVETSTAVFFAAVIICCAIGIEVLVGYFTTIWHFKDGQVKVTSNRAWLFGKRELTFLIAEVERIDTKCVTNKFERLAIYFSNGRRLKLYHSIFSSRENFRQLSRTLRRSVSKCG